MAYVTITVRERTKERLDAHRDEGQSWVGFMTAIADDLDADDVQDAEPASAAEVEAAVDDLRDDLLTMLPGAVAEEMAERQYR